MKRATSFASGNPKRLKRTQSVVLVRQPTQRQQFGPSLSKETGYVDTIVTPVQGNTTGSIALINTVASGTGVTQRVGKKIQLKGLQIRGVMSPDSAATFATYALMIIWDRRPAGALPAITDILVTTSQEAMLNDANSSRFKVLWRSDDYVGPPGGDHQAHVYNEYVKFSKKSRSNRTTYKAAGTGVIADIDEGALYFVAVGGNVAGSGDATGTINMRLRFWDI